MAREVFSTWWSSKKLVRQCDMKTQVFSLQKKKGAGGEVSMVVTFIVRAQLAGHYIFLLRSKIF